MDITSVVDFWTEELKVKTKVMKRLNRAIQYGVIVFVFWVATLSPQPVSASPLPLPPFPYQEQGLFVQVPAVIGGVLLAVPGAVIGPVVCVFTGYNFSPEPLKKLGDCSAIGALFSSIVGSTIVGFPFYVVKKIFRDFPLLLLDISSRPVTTEKSPPAVVEEPLDERQIQERVPDTAAP